MAECRSRGPGSRAEGNRGSCQEGRGLSRGRGPGQGQGSRPGDLPPGLLGCCGHPCCCHPPGLSRVPWRGPARSPSCLLPSHPLCSSEPPRGPSIGAGSSVDTSKPLRMARGSGGWTSLQVSIIQDITSQAPALQKGQHLFPGLALRWSCHTRPSANPSHPAQVGNSLLTCLLHVCSSTGPSGPSEGAQVRGQGVKCYCPLLADFRISHGLYSPWNSPGQNTGVGTLSLLQGIFPTQGPNQGPPHCRQLSHMGSPSILE